MSSTQSSPAIPYEIPGSYFENCCRYLNVTSPEILQQIEEFPLHDGDILLCGYLRSGNVWTKTILDAIYHQDDLETFQNTSPLQLENQLDFNFHSSSSLPRPSLFWTHLQYSKLPNDAQKKNTKIIYVLRDPKDVAVSYYHLHHGLGLFGPWKGSWEVFLDAFLDGSVLYGSWFDHVKSFINHRTDPNLLFVKYEDLMQNTKDWIAKIADFLERSLDKTKVDKIAEIVDFKNMKANPHLDQRSWCPIEPGHSFLRKGIIGDYKSHFTHEQFHRIQEKLEDVRTDTGFDDYLLTTHPRDDTC